MLRDFKQQLTRNADSVSMLIEDTKTKSFLLSAPLNEKDPYYNDGVYSPISFKVSKDDDGVLVLAKHLHSLGLSIVSFRELARASSVDFSLADDTPGTITDVVCLHVTVDVVQVNLEERNIVPLPLHDVFEKLGDSDEVIIAGLAQLELERAFRAHFNQNDATN